MHERCDGETCREIHEAPGNQVPADVNVSPSQQVSGEPYSIETAHLISGVVNGSIYVSAPEGRQLTYSLYTAPSMGSVAVDASTGAWQYTPTQAARLHAGLANGSQTDRFIVAVSSPEFSIDVTVDPTIAPASFSVHEVPIAGRGNLTGLAVTENHAYVNARGRGVIVIDATTNTVIGEPLSIDGYGYKVAVRPDESHIYVATCWPSAGMVLEIYPPTNTVTSIVSVDGYPEDLAVSADGRRIYVVGHPVYSNQPPGSVTVIDAVSKAVIGEAIPVGHGPLGVAVTPDGARAYITNGDDGTLSVIDTATNTVTETIDVGTFPWKIAVGKTPRGVRGYVTMHAEENGSVAVIDTMANAPVGEPIVVGRLPAGVALSPDGSLLYVANMADPSVSVIDTSTNAEIVKMYLNPVVDWIAVSPSGSQLFCITGDKVTVMSIVPAEYRFSNDRQRGSTMKEL